VPHATAFSPFSTPPADGDWKVLGWDAAGIVQEVGPDVTQFAVGDEVYYAGSLIRPGTNAEFHLVDARIVGRKPASLDWAEAAALPLTTLRPGKPCSIAWT
jgi:NADPH2:quinone reductase